MATGQSAIELLSVYGLMLLVIGVVVSILFIFTSMPESLLPTQCTFYSGFDCLDSGYFVVSQYQSQLAVVAVDTQAGVVNITGFSASFGFTQSTSGYCTPTVVTQGQTVFCIANLSFQSKLGDTYTGTYQITGNYCAYGPLNINSSCPGSSKYQYGGGARVQATTPVAFVTYAVSPMQSVSFNVLVVDSSGYRYGQLPLTATYQHGTTHSYSYYYTIVSNSSKTYVFKSISGCGVKAISGRYVSSTSCTITATYNGISYGSCPSIPNSGGANLMGIVAKYCNLTGYDMAGDNLNSANLFGSNLRNADVAGSNLNYANISATILVNAVLTGVNFNHEIMVGVDASGLTALSGSNFNYANMTYANFQGANMAGSNFQGIYAPYSNWQGANVAGSNFQNANLTNANMQGADTSGSSFSGANVVGCTGCP